ncbi:hypothetical protein KP614_02925 [Treponema denticola]
METPADSRFGYSVFWIDWSQSVRHSDYSFAKLSEAQGLAFVAVFYTVYEKSPRADSQSLTDCRSLGMI